MSISSEISRISGNVSDALTAIANKGVTVPSGSNSDDLADLIGQISGGGGTTWETVYDDSVNINISEDDFYVSIIPFGYTINQNSVWKITWNGTPYECTATSVGDTTYPPYALGNDTIIHLQGGNNEPFYLQKTDATTLAVISATSQTVSLKIEKQVSGGIVISDTTDAAGGTIRTITATDTTTLISKTVTQNGTYDPADDNADGYSEVIVDVSGGGGTTWETLYTGTADPQDWGDPQYYVLISDFFVTQDALIVGDTYRITWNGVAYECIAFNGNVGGTGAVIGSPDSSFTDYPFAAQCFSNDDLLFMTPDYGITFQLKIEHQVSGGGGGSTLVPKNITANGTYDPADDNADGYSEVTVALPSGTEGTPTATKGTVSNHSISVTPSVTNTAGVITGGTRTGTAVTVSASELVSGSETKTSNGTYDVTNLAQIIVNVSSGSGIGTLLNTTSIGAVSTTSTQAASLNVSCSVSNINNYDLLIVESSVNTKTNGRHAATVGLIFLTGGSSIGTKDGATVATVKLNTKLSSNGTATSVAGTTAYGIYPNSCSVSSGTATIPMYRRYNGTSTGTINGTYTARVYGVNLYNLIGG